MYAFGVLINSNGEFRSIGMTKKIDEPIVKGFASELRRRRQDAKMTLETLAELSGLTPNYIGNIENGYRDPSLTTVCALANALGVEPRVLFGLGNLSARACEAGRLYEEIEPVLQGAVFTILKESAQTHQSGPPPSDSPGPGRSPSAKKP